MAYKTYTKGGFNITEDRQFSNEKHNITPALTKRFENLYFEVKESPTKALVKEIESLIKTNPNCPQLKNYLAVAYEGMGEKERFLEINNQILAEHPDYLFGRLTQANICIKQNNFDEALQLLGSSLSLNDLFPKRDLFHLSEVLGYLKVVIIYQISLGDTTSAEAVLNQMKEISEDHIEVDEAESMLMHSTMDIAKDYMDNLNSIKENSGIRILENVIQTTHVPNFNHAEINYLYTNGLDIDVELLREILALPRETLIEDLELVLIDAEVRYKYFLELEYEESAQSFPLHAIFLLMELNAESSLSKILGLLNGDEDFLDFWLSDHLTETIWQCLYKLGYTDTKLLADVLVDETFYTFVKTSVSEALGQMALHNEAKQAEVAQIYTNTLNHYNVDDFQDDLIDHKFIGGVIGDTIDIGHTELLPTIKELFEKGYVDTFSSGTYDVVVNEFDKRNVEFHKRKVCSIFEIYGDVLVSWAGYNPGKEFSGRAENGWGFSDLYQQPSYPKIEPIRVEPKIGRNDACPCGSGKKHKKCCMAS